MKKYIRCAVKNFLSEDFDIKKDVAKDPNTDMHNLQLLATDPDRFIRLEVASNPHTSAEILKMLIADDYTGVRNAVARNPNVTAPLLKLLSKDRSVEVRHSVIISPNVTEDILVDMVLNDPDDDTFLIASNRNAPIKVLETIYENTDESDWQILYHLVKSKNVTTELLQKLAKHKNFSVNMPAKRKLGILP